MLWEVYLHEEKCPAWGPQAISKNTRPTSLPVYTENAVPYQSHGESRSLPVYTENADPYQSHRESRSLPVYTENAVSHEECSFILFQLLKMTAK